MKKPPFLDDSTSSTGSNKFGPPRMMSIYRMSDAQPDWSETDPSQPDYIANKDIAEKWRPVYVDGQLVLDSSRESGALCLLSGQNVLLQVMEDNSIKIHSSGGSGGEDPGFNQTEIEFEDGFTVTTVTEGFDKKQVVSLDAKYINEQLIAPALSGIVQTIGNHTTRLSAVESIAALLVGDDKGKSIRQIAEEVIQSSDIVTTDTVEGLVKTFTQEEIAAWAASSGFNNIIEVVDITKPISKYVEEEINKKISGGGGDPSVPATPEILGSVKIDGETIKMNEKQQIYVSSDLKLTTDNLVQGEQTLVLNGGNDL